MKNILLSLCLSLIFFSGIAVASDFNNDGTADIAIFRPSSGLWAIRALTRCYFGMAGDNPIPDDYNGNGNTDIAVFRPSTGLWAVRNISRVYFGSGGDTPISGSGINYNPAHFYVNPVTGSVGIKTDEPSVELELGQWADGGDVIFHGDEASGDSRLIWDSQKGSLRFGGMGYSSKWSEETPGDFSLSVGWNTTARGGCSAAIGDNVSTTQGGSLAVGYAVNAGGSNSIAVGRYVGTVGGQSMAFGSCISAQTDNAIVIGSGADEYYPYWLTNNIPDSLMVGFNTSTDPTFFVDSIGIGVGTTSPARKLHVNDVMRLEPRNTVPDNPSQGDIYFNSIDAKLKCYDGSTWQDCF